MTKLSLKIFNNPSHSTHNNKTNPSLNNLLNISNNPNLLQELLNLQQPQLAAQMSTTKSSQNIHPVEKPIMDSNAVSKETQDSGYSNGNFSNVSSSPGHSYINSPSNKNKKLEVSLAADQEMADVIETCDSKPVKMAALSQEHMSKLNLKSQELEIKINEIQSGSCGSSHEQELKNALIKAQLNNLMTEKDNFSGLMNSSLCKYQQF